MSYEIMGGNKNYPNYLNVIVNYHYHGKYRVITWQFLYMVIVWDANMDFWPVFGL